MIVDAYDRSGGTALEADVAIVGGGLAGLTLARELAVSENLRVVILESGGAQPEAHIEDLNRGRCIIDTPGGRREFSHHMQESRCRCLGGSGVLWGGKCAELDPIDFQPRRWINDSGWPFTYEEFKPYLHRACAVLGIPYFRSNASRQAGDTRAPLIVNHERTVGTGLRRYSSVTARAPQNKFMQFIERVTAHPAVSVYLHATVNKIISAGSEITGLQAVTPAGAMLSVRADAYVLAAGGIENARLLLANSIGNDNGLVGRYFMGHVIHRQTHPHFARNVLRSAMDRSLLSLYIDKTPTELQGVFRLTGNAQRRDRIANCTLTFEDASSSEEAIPIYYMNEQRPNPDSKILLVEDKDATGVPRALLNWRFMKEDFDDLGRGMAIFADEFARHGVGTLEYGIDDSALVHLMETARHHLGSTRMHAEPQRGVVDSTCRVHGVENLYVTGASVFPTSGVSNPTLSILALSIRLADHLRSSSRSAARRTDVAIVNIS